MSGAAYAISCGKRLPQFAECAAIEELFSSKAQSPSEPAEIREYRSLPKCKKGDIYPFGLVSEWTYQVDHRRFWEQCTQWQHDGKQFPTSQIPTLSRDELSRTEYLIYGTSYLQHENPVRNSKLATWINQDQGFRCVLDHEELVRRGQFSQSSQNDLNRSGDNSV